jgi:hypothetical protein
MAMNPNHDEIPRDETLSSLYKETAKAEPPAALDALILAAARREAATTAPRPAQRRDRPWWRNWLAPAGAIATIVLAVSLTLSIEREQREPLPVAASAPAPAPGAELAESARASSVPVAKPAVPAVDTSARVRKSIVQGELPLAQPAPMPSADRAAEAAVPSASAPSAIGRRTRNETGAETPERWLDEIRRLKAAGQHVQASEQLKSFQRSHPDYPLPDDLKPAE